MNNQHTPGPWRYHIGRGSKLRFHVQTEGGFQIASTPSAEAFHEANANLIAQAPDLLAQRNALLEALQAIDKLSCNCPLMSLQVQHEFEQSNELDSYRVELAKLILEMRQQARNAIALAQGGDK